MPLWNPGNTLYMLCLPLAGRLHNFRLQNVSAFYSHAAALKAKVSSFALRSAKRKAATSSSAIADKVKIEPKVKIEAKVKVQSQT